MKTTCGTIFVMSCEHLLRHVIYFLHFPKSKCGGKCNPTNKKRKTYDPLVRSGLHVY